MIGSQSNFKSNHNGKLHWCVECPIVPKKEQSRIGFIGLCNVSVLALFGRKPMDDAALKMARECYVEYMRQSAEKAGDTVVQASVDRLLSVEDDHMHGVQIALAMHAMMHARMQGELERKDALLRSVDAHGFRCAPLCSFIGGYGYCNCGAQDLRAAINKELGQ